MVIYHPAHRVASENPSRSRSIEAVGKVTELSSLRKAAVFSILTCEKLREKSDEKEEIRPACCVVIWSQHNRLGDAIFVVMVVENARADRSMEPRFY